MTQRARLRTAGLAGILLAGLLPAAAGAQGVNVPLTPGAWVATDSMRFVSYLGRPSLYINRGVALVRGASMGDGVLDLDLAASDATTFLGVVFRAATPRFSNVLFLRPGASGTVEAVQYGPAFNGLGVAWQVYHGDGANAVAVVPRNRWIHVRLELDGLVARVYVDTATTPTLVVPRVVASGGAGLGVWAGPFGRGAYYSNIRYSGTRSTSGEVPAAPPPAGTILGWELSSAIEAADFTPAVLPDLGQLTWQRRPDQPLPGGTCGRRAEGRHGGRPG
jgi:hypothetical protein